MPSDKLTFLPNVSAALRLAQEVLERVSEFVYHRTSGMAGILGFTLATLSLSGRNFGH
jgi:hypothetical protein